jgi:hypothetical protein
MTTNSLLRVIAIALAFTAACKSDFQAGINQSKDGSVQEAGASQDGVSPTVQDGSSPADSVPWSCDPFSPTTKPITLTNVLGAGQDTDGTLYVVDQPQPGGERVFVSSGGTLQRQRIAGSGTESSGNGVVSYSLSVSDHVPPFMLELETNTAGPTAMGVLQKPPLDIKTFTIGQQGSVLTLVPAAQVAALPVANIPAQTFIEYNATLSDGRALLVVRPRDDWTYQDFRVFFGSPGHMVERTVDQVVRYQDGGSTTINFAVDGVPAVASFPVSLTGVAAPPTLTLAGTSFPLTLGPTDSPPADESYFCLGNPPVDGGVDALSTPADGPAACRAPSPDYGPTSTFPVLPNGTPAAATTCPAACGNSAWPGPWPMDNVDIALPYGECAAGTPSCSALGTVPCACGGGSGPTHGFNCSCEGGTWICRILYPGTAICLPCPDAGVGDGPNDAAPAPQGIFVPKGNMTVARSGHTATLLPNGKVLIAGGRDTQGSFLASAELYNAVLGTFTATGSMTVARSGHTATLLPNGKVLIAGGAEADGMGFGFPSAELYDPTVGTFTAIGSATAARLGHTATLLPDGNVLIAGGVGYCCGDESATVGAFAGAQLYDPSVGRFTDTGSMTVTRGAHAATLLPDGKVLIVGGELFDNNNGEYAALTSAELYDPAAGTFAATGGMAVARGFPVTTLLPSGKVLVAGGSDGANALASAELYDPAAGSFATTGNLTTVRESHTATLLPSGKTLVAGGSDGVNALASVELYDPAAGSFATAGSLSVARSAHTATLLPNGGVLVVGGEGSDAAALASAELYQ